MFMPLRTGIDADSMSTEVEEVYSMRDMLLAFEDPVACIEAMAWLGNATRVSPRLQADEQGLMDAPLGFIRFHATS